jgi:hypothetical protein
VLLVQPGKRSPRARVVSLLLIPLCILAIHLNKRANLSDRLQIHVDSHQASLLYEDFTLPNECLPLAGLYQYLPGFLHYLRDL